MPTYSDAMQDFPFLLDLAGHQPKHNYTAVIYVQVGNTLTPTSALYRLVKAVTKSQFVDRVSNAGFFILIPLFILTSGCANVSILIASLPVVADFNFMGLRSASTSA